MRILTKPKTQPGVLDETEILEHGAFNFSRNATFNPHMHKQIELHYVVSGEVEVIINHVPYVAKENELVIIKSYDLHECKGGKKNKLISPILPDEMTNLLMGKNIKSQIIKDVELELEHILNLSKMFIKHSPRVRGFYFTMLTQAILSYCGENLAKEGLSDAILVYINDNSQYNLTLDSVAKGCCTNRCEVSKVVNSRTGQNFNGYINLIRVGHFLDIYAQNRNSSISVIAEGVGFASLRTFYRAFAALYNCSPTEYFDTHN